MSPLTPGRKQAPRMYLPRQKYPTSASGQRSPKRSAPTPSVSPSETITTVSFSHGRKGTKLAEFDILASQTLAELRDAFYCEADCEPGIRRCLVRVLLL